MNENDLEAKTIQTYDATAGQWAKSHAIVNDWAWAAKELHRLLPAGKILEIGCGGGRDAAELLGLGYEYVGTDASREMVRTARAEVPAADIRQCNIYDLRTLDTKFDGFWACAVLLHIPKSRIDEALSALSATLNPGAIGMISIKDGDKEDFEVRDTDEAHEERLFVYWRKDEFLDALERHGFELLDYAYKPLSERTKWHIFFLKHA